MPLSRKRGCFWFPPPLQPVGKEGGGGKLVLDGGRVWIVQEFCFFHRVWLLFSSLRALGQLVFVLLSSPLLCIFSVPSSSSSSSFFFSSPSSVHGLHLHLSPHPSPSLSLCLYVCMFVYLYVCQSVSLSTPLPLPSCLSLSCSFSILFLTICRGHVLTEWSWRANWTNVC